MSDLLPAMCCGRVPRSGGTGLVGTQAFVECPVCCFSAWGRTLEIAIGIWNAAITRAPIPVPFDVHEPKPTRCPDTLDMFEDDSKN